MPSVLDPPTIVASSSINPKDKCLLLHPPKSLENTDALSYFDETKDLTRFHQMMHDEPHIIRRKQILEKHPEVKQLFKKNPKSFLIVLLLVGLQLGILNLIQHMNWPVYIACMFLVGSTINHTLYLLMHDLTHYTCFETMLSNQLGAIVTNLAQALPSSIAFGRFHRDHHTYMGIPLDDPDLPSKWEIGFLTSPVKKFMFIFLMPLFYSMRPYLVKPKRPIPMEILNIIVIAISDLFIYRIYGLSGLLYLILGTFIGLGLNPLGAHIIAEHYEFVKGQETYSYYGIANYVNLNIGYHVEHHDFPMIPWSNLPKLRKLAPEFYENIPCHTSYLGVWRNFIFDHTMGAWSRIERKNPPDQDEKKIQ